MTDYSYSYDWDEQYCYPHSNNAPIRLAYYLSEINVLHPFREGNGRTQRLFIEYLANVAGYEVDFSDVTAHEMIVASAESFACNYDKINALFERITNPISEEDQRAAISVFFGSRSQQMKLFEDINEENQFTPLL